MEKKVLKIVQTEAEKLLKLLKIKGKIKVEADEEGVIFVSLENSEEEGILIGYHGETLSSLQLVLNLLVSQKRGEWVCLVVNVGDYRQRREESLREMALRIAQRVEETEEEMTLPYLSAAERRIIHLFLKDHPRVISQSEGEGGNRRLIITRRKT